VSDTDSDVKTCDHRVLSTTAHSFESGALVAGRYQLGASLGAGGFGVVFSAFDTKLQREVAVKVLHHGDRDPVVLSRFYREIELARQLSHPNTVRLYECGETESGVPFIAWELLRGRSLEQLIRRERALPVDRVARIGVQILKSLMEAHALGIVHRDIKPANVFLCDYAGEQDFVKVLDFGIATLDAAAQKSPLTEEGTTVGTPPYMAPEQVMHSRIDARTDLYALGLVLAEALAGYRVYTDKVSIRVCMEQASPKPVPLQHTVIVSALGPVIKRATQKKPDARYASAAEMLADLEAATRPAISAPQQLPAIGATTPIAQPATVTGVAFTPPRQAIPFAPPRSPTSRGFIIATAAAGIFVTAAVAGWMFPGTLTLIEKLTTDKPPKRPTKSQAIAPRKRHAALEGLRIRGIDAQQILDRLAAEGWVVAQETFDDNQSFASVQYALVRGTDHGGMLMFYRCKSDDLARSTEESFQNQRAAVAREQRDVLAIALGDKALNAPLLERLLR